MLSTRPVVGAVGGVAAVLAFRGDRVTWRAPTGAMSVALLREVRAREGGLVALLRRNPAVRRTGPRKEPVMALLVTCRGCGQEYEPKAGDVIAGRWRLCPGCRDAEPGPSGSPASGVLR